MWWSIASAATLTVGPGQMYPGIQAAVTAAADGDTIEIQPGTYRTSTTVDKSLSFVGVGAVTLQPAGGALSVVLRFDADGSVQGIRFDGQGGHTCVVVDGTGGLALTLHESTIEDCSTGLSVLESNTAVVTDSAFRFNGTGISGDGSVDVRRSRFIDNGFGASLSSGSVGSLFASDLFARNTNAGLSFGAVEGQVVVGSAFCGHTGSGAIDATAFSPSAGDRVVISHNRFWDNHGSSGAAVDLRNAGYGTTIAVDLVSNTFADNDGGAAAHVAAVGASLNLVNNVFALGGVGPAVWSQSTTGFYGQPLTGTVTGDYDLFWDNAGGDLAAPQVPANLGTHTLWATDPEFRSYVADGDCRDDLGLAPGSPAIDAGDPSRTDPDGSRSDIGWVRP